jgi:hypothetical protein
VVDLTCGRCGVKRSTFKGYHTEQECIDALLVKVGKLEAKVASDKLRRIADYEPIFAELRLDYDRAILCIREMQRLALARNLAGDELADAVEWRRRLVDEKSAGPGSVTPMMMHEAECEEGDALLGWVRRR